jgi:hypothetical protein
LRRKKERMKQLILTISPDMWKAYRAAITARFNFDVGETQAEEIAKMDMWQGLQNTINRAEIEKPLALTEGQKALIKLFLGEQCTDGYLMTKLGIFDWKDAQVMIEQYEREGRNE